MREEVLEELGRPEQLTVLEAPCNPTLQKVKHLVPGKGNNGAKTRAAPWAHCHRAAGVPVMLWGPYLHLTAGRIPRDTHLKHVKTHIPPQRQTCIQCPKDTPPNTHTYPKHTHTSRDTHCQTYTLQKHTLQNRHTLTHIPKTHRHGTHRNVHISKQRCACTPPK